MDCQKRTLKKFFPLQADKAGAGANVGAGVRCRGRGKCRGRPRASPHAGDGVCRGIIPRDIVAEICPVGQAGWHGACRGIAERDFMFPK